MDNIGETENVVQKSKRKKSQQDALRRKREDNERIEKAMELLDKAKNKARAQREEYGKFLQWKVKMQRREMKLRQKEEESQRQRIETELAQVLKDYKTKKRTFMSQFRGPPAKPQTLMASPLAPLDPQFTDADATTDLSREVTTLSSAVQPVSTIQAMPGAGGRAAVSFESGGPFDKLRDRITFEDVLSLPNIDGQAPVAPAAPAVTLKDLMALIEHRNLQPNAAPTAVAPKKIRKMRSSRKAAAEFDTMVTMFRKAQLRRDHATQLMLADPPADYLPHTAMQYESVTAEAEAKALDKASNPFFLTEAAFSADDELDSLSHPHGSASQNITRRIGRRGKYRHFSWDANLRGEVMQPTRPATEGQQQTKAKSLSSFSTVSASSQEIDQNRQAVEDLTSLHSYLDHVEKYTKVRRRYVTGTRKPRHHQGTFLPEV